MYAVKNYRTKKELKEAVKSSMILGATASCLVREPQGVPCYQPGPFGPDVKDGEHTCEGPHYPEAHKWYARCLVRGMRIVKVLG